MRTLTLRLMMTASLVAFGASAVAAQDAPAIKIPEPLAGAAEMVKEAPAVVVDETKKLIKKMGEGADAAADATKEAAGEAKDAAGAAMEKAGDAASDMMKKTGDAANAAADGAKDAAGAAAGMAKDAATDAGNMAKDAAGAMTDTAKQAEPAITIPEPISGASDIANQAPTIPGADSTAAAPAADTAAPAADAAAKPADTMQKDMSGGSASGGTMAASGDKPGMHTIASGDTLWDIAKGAYGDATKWKMIEDANPGVTPKNLKIGAELNVPAN